MKYYTRKFAKDEAELLGMRYRMTRNGDVDFYDPFGDEPGWYRVGWWKQTHQIEAIHPNDPNAKIQNATCVRSPSGAHMVEFENGESFSLETLAWDFTGRTAIPDWLAHLL